jgi:putative ABC transport system permease protein
VRVITITALLTLALGIGANVTIFSITDTLLLRPLNYGEPDRLVAIWEIVPALGAANPVLPANPKHVRSWRDECSSFEDIAEMDVEQVSLGGIGNPEQITINGVSWNFFRVLGVQAQFGRTFVAEEDQPDHSNVVVLTHSLWQRRFGNQQVLGKKNHY